MKSPALNAYAKHYSQMQASKALCEKFKAQAIKELTKKPKGQAVVAGIEFHKSSSTSVDLPESIKNRIKAIRKKAVDDGIAKVKTTKTIVGTIPKSTVNAVLSKASKDYLKHFGNN